MTGRGAEPHQKGKDPMARKTETIDRERYLLLKGMLEDRRREIHEKLRSLRESIPAEAPDVRDVEEQSVDEFDRAIEASRPSARARLRVYNPQFQGYRVVVLRLK